MSSFVEAEGSNFNREELSFIVRDFAGAGLETTSSTLIWASILLTNHPAVQDRLHAEIDSVVGHDRAPCLDDRKR